jgi:hypothetical protein
MQTEAQKRANRKYDKANTRQIALKLNKRTDADVLEHLDKCGNKQGYIKALIRADMAGER